MREVELQEFRTFERNLTDKFGFVEKDGRVLTTLDNDHPSVTIYALRLDDDIVGQSVSRIPIDPTTGQRMVDVKATNSYLIDDSSLEREA